MEELKKKCHTDDDSSFDTSSIFEKIGSPFFSALWLDQAKTLRQQDIDEQATVVLRRKYFFSDTNIDQRDPVQLNLLYIQVRNPGSEVNRTHGYASVSQWNPGWYTPCDL